MSGTDACAGPEPESCDRATEPDAGASCDRLAGAVEVIAIFGPTASGKSAVAEAVADGSGRRSCRPTRCRSTAACRSSRTSRRRPTRLVGDPLARGGDERRRVRGARARGDRRARRSARDARSSPAAPGSTSAPRSPSSTSRRPPRPSARPRSSEEVDERSRRRARAARRRSIPRGGRASTRTTGGALVRALELAESGRVADGRTRTGSGAA